MLDFNEMIDRYLYRETRPKQIGRYYPSEIGGCLRKIWFTYKIPKETRPELTRIFEAGNILHGFVVDVLKSEKIPEVELLETESSLKMEIGDFAVYGRVDDIIVLKHKNEKILVEAKSCKNIESIIEPSPAYIMQLQFYLYATGIRKGIILYIEKNNLRSKTFTYDYDEEIAMEAIERFKKLHKSLKNNILPEAEAMLDEKKKWMCEYCDYKDECIKNGKESVKNINI